MEIFLNKLKGKDFEVFFENEFAVATNNSITNFLERKSVSYTHLTLPTSNGV